MPQPRSRRKRYALVGAGARAEMYARALALDFAGQAELAALVDVNQARMDYHNARLAELGARPVPTYKAGDFHAMLEKEGVDAVIVTTVDRYHDEYAVAALEAGRDVITEKPMAIDVPSCQRILQAQARSGRQVTVTFNYRYNPVHERVAELLAEGCVGEIGSVHFEWLLDVRHGADYFRRWHREKANSGGLMVHKASHHFDLLNWWLRTEPETVYGMGRRFFYGEENGRRHGNARPYRRAHGEPAAAGDPFALDLASSPALKGLYLDAEHEDGYYRDQNVFGPGITIEDDMAVMVRYASGATLTYHLTAYSPWEGYRLAVNGSRGRLELEVVENAHVNPALARTVKSASLHGSEAPAEEGWVRLSLHPFWEPPAQIPLLHTRAGHGGADQRMLAALFGGDGEPDPLGRRSTQREGALALLVGVAANHSFETGQPVRVADLLEVR